MLTVMGSLIKLDSYDTRSKRSVRGKVRKLPARQVGRPCETPEASGPPTTLVVSHGA